MIKQEFKTGVFYNADCFEVMETIEAGSIDMVLADLPYGTTQNKWDCVLPFEKLWENYWRVCRLNSMIALTASQPFTSALIMSQPKLFKHEWIWIKNRGSNFANTVREPMKEHESVLMFSKGKWTYNKQMQERTGSGADRVKHGVAFKSQSSNYRDFESRGPAKLPEMRVPSSWQKFNCEVGIHPTQKPVALFEYLIKTYTNEGETILDNVAGSGTTAIAAINTGRKWICIEKDPDYFEKACQRVFEAERGMK